MMAFSPTTKQILHPSNKRETSRRDADKTRQQLRNYIHKFEKSPSHQSGVRQKERDDYVTRFLKLATLLSPSTMMSLSLSLLSLGYKTKPINSTWKTHRVFSERPQKTASLLVSESQTAVHRERPVVMDTDIKPSAARG